MSRSAVPAHFSLLIADRALDQSHPLEWPPFHPEECPSISELSGLKQKMQYKLPDIRHPVLDMWVEKLRKPACELFAKVFDFFHLHVHVIHLEPIPACWVTDGIYMLQVNLGVLFCKVYIFLIF